MIERVEYSVTVPRWLYRLAYRIGFPVTRRVWTDTSDDSKDCVQSHA